MAGVYRPRHPERTVLYRVLFHYFDRFLAEYKSRFEKKYGFFRPIIKEVVERYLDCGNPRCGFARIRCPDCHAEHLLMFSCRTRGFCPSCHAKRLEEWGEWMRETLLLDVPHRQVVFTIPKMLRIFFKYKRRLLGDLCRCALRSLTCYFEVVTGSELMLGVIAAIQTFGNRMNPHPHLHFLVTEGGRVTSHIPDKGQVTVRYYGLYANAHRGKVKKASLGPFPLRMVEEELRPFPSQGWAEMIRKVYEVDPMVCPQCGGTMKVIAFLTDYPVVDRIINHLKLTFVAERPPPPHLAYQEVLTFSPKPTLTSFDVRIYASLRWLERITKAKMRPQPADPKNQFLL
jgi:ribosomal protein S27E